MQNFKVMTVSSDNFCAALELIEKQGLMFLYDLWHEGNQLVTITYTTQINLMEYNLSKLSKRELQKLCRKDGVSIKGMTTVRKLTTPQDVTKFARAARSEAVQRKDQAAINHWDDVIRNLKYSPKDFFGQPTSWSKEDLKNAIKWRKQQFRKMGIPYTKEVMEEGMLSTKCLINRLIYAGDSVWNLYGYGICD